MISYAPLWETMKSRGVTKYYLIYKCDIPKHTLLRMSRNMPATTTTLNDLCEILNCKISDIVEYVPKKKQSH
jgi:DNA-binding Xre family transcriptional regulator